MPMVRWIELWFFELMPMLFYMGTVYFAYQLYHKPVFSHDYWHWSFLWLMLATVGLMLIRMQALVLLWQGGREAAWAGGINAEHVMAAWCVGVGLMTHTFLLYRHPIWRSRVGMTSQAADEGTN